MVYVFFFKETATTEIYKYRHTITRHDALPILRWHPSGEMHPLLRGLGPEPLGGDGAAFDGDYLFARSRGRRAPVKTFLMDQRVVVGVGNIYAAEALFAA